MPTDFQTDPPIPPAAAPTTGETSRASAADFKQDGEQLAGKAVDALQSEADKRKDGLADQAKSISRAVSSAADAFEKQGDQLPVWLTNGVRTVASSVEQFAGTLDGKSSTELFSEVKKFAGDRPGIFLAACAAAGFAASRVLSAGNNGDSGQ